MFGKRGTDDGSRAAPEFRPPAPPPAAPGPTGTMALDRSAASVPSMPAASPTRRPLEPLLARDDIADIMVNGSKNVYIEVNGKVQQTSIRFRDNQQLLNICQRIVSQVGRRVDESSPICDARLPDGSRVNVIAPPLSIDGPALTIRKFKKDKLTLDQLVKYGTITPEGAVILQIIARSRCNVLVSGGT